jgi:ATP/maltotriose-dependent transcriptional regulator MalT
MKIEKFDETLTKKTVEVYVKINIQMNNGAEQYSLDSVEIPRYTDYVNEPINESKQIENTESIGITNRERQVIPLVADGLSNKEIAKKLNLSVYTVKSHIHNILTKLAINKRVQIARHAYQSKYFINTI